MIPIVTDVTADHWTAVIRLFTRRTDPRYLSILTLQHNSPHVTSTIDLIINIKIHQAKIEQSLLHGYDTDIL